MIFYPATVAHIDSVRMQCITFAQWLHDQNADAGDTCGGTGQEAGVGTCVCEDGYSGQPTWDFNKGTWNNPCISKAFQPQLDHSISMTLPIFSTTRVRADKHTHIHTQH